MDIQYFTTVQICVLSIGCFLVLLSITNFQKGKENASLVLLFLGTLCLGSFMALLDPFLVLWDEQYHALVAKNLMQNPLQPTLYKNPLLNYDYKNWTNNHVWLHKQPMFLWQIALSLKCFGINTFAVRLPNIVMHAFTTILIFRIGKLCSNNIIGFYGALFFAVSNHFLELVAGKIATDHNDVAFLFYVTASFWAWFEFKQCKKRYLIATVGLFAGFAVLTKWLVGLLVFVLWFVAIVTENKGKLWSFSSYKNFLLSLAMALLVFLPWQFFILHQYTREASYEYALNTQHFFTAIENQGGNIWFHFNALKNIYGSSFLMPAILLVGIGIFLKNVNTVNRFAIASTILVTYIFYTVAATKMVSFCIIVSPYFYLGIGAFVAAAFNRIKNKFPKTYYFQIAATTLICVSLFNFGSIVNHHTNKKPQNNGRQADLDVIVLINNLKQQLGNNKYVVFVNNGRLNAHIPIMFYTNFIAYNFIPTELEIKKVIALHYKIAVVNDNGLPNYLRNNQNIKIIY